MCMCLYVSFNKFSSSVVCLGVLGNILVQPLNYGTVTYHSITFATNIFDYYNEDGYYYLERIFCLMHYYPLGI